MNAREKKLLIALVTVVGIGLIGIGVSLWFVVPLMNYNKTINAMTIANNNKWAEIAEFNRERKKLVLARLKSLPASPNEATTEYVHYLQEVLPQSGLKVEQVTPSQTAAEVKPVTSIPGIKKVGHQLMSFQVKARGTMAQLVRALEQMQRTPYEHRIKNLAIDRADNTPKDANTKLIINMTIETLLVAKTESKAGVPPGVDVRFLFADSLAAGLGGSPGLGQALATVVMMHAAPPPSGRNYADMAKRNIFVGAIPKPPPDPPKKKIVVVDNGPPPPQPPPGYLKYIRLVGTETVNSEAHFLNLYYRKDEKKISAKPNSGYDTFLIASDDRSYVFFLAKVLRVDNRDVFFQVKDKVYQWHLGDTLESAYSSALTLDTLDAIDLEQDFAFAKSELEKEKASKQPQRNKKSGGGR